MPEQVIDADEEALRAFLLDIECLDKLKPWTDKFNLFDVLKISRTEIRHSNMLGWLLDANENHGLDDRFIKALLQELIEKDSSGRYDPFKILLMDMYSFSVLREDENIDLLMISSEEKTLFAIENKVDSHEHSDQLNRYRTLLERTYPDYQKYYLYLTPQGEEPSDAVHWDILTYEEVLSALDRSSQDVCLLLGAKLMINDYKDVIRRQIVEDQELIDVCNGIYNKHKRALDLIQEYKTDEKSVIKGAIVEVLKEKDVKGEINYSKKNGSCSFSTKSMSSYLPDLSGPNGSWGNEAVYSYWFEIKNDKNEIGLRGWFELGLWNVPDETWDKMEVIVKHLPTNKTLKRSGKYCRAFHTPIYKFKKTEDIEADAKEKACKIIAEIKSMEEELLKAVGGTNEARLVENKL